MKMHTSDFIEEFKWNIQDLPVEEITIATTDGPQEINALLLGDWALNTNAKGWTVTHRKTGYAAKSWPTPIEALIELGIILGAGLSVPDDVVTGGFAAIPNIREIGARVKTAHTILESWDLDLDYNEPAYTEE